MNALLPIGMGMSLGGQVMTGVGEAQGARAAAGQAQRQADAEARARGAEMDALEREIAKTGASMRGDNLSPQLRTQFGATAGVPAYGRALGLGLQGAQRIRGRLLTQGAARAQADAAAQQAAQDQIRRSKLGTDIAAIRFNQDQQRLSYPGALELAKAEHGNWWRQGGALMSSLGGPLSMLGMMGGGGAQPTDAGAVSAQGTSHATYNPATGGGGYSGPGGYNLLFGRP